MNQKITFEQGTYKILFYRFKALIIPLTTIVVCFFIFLNVIIPQLQDFFLLKEEEQQMHKKISILKDNLNFLSTMDESALDSKLKVINAALPLEKDYLGILNAIVKASNNAGVYVDDYSFQVGELSTKSAQTTVDNPSINLLLTVNGSIEKNKRFLNELNKSLPLSEVTSVQMNRNSTTIRLVFYYKFFSSLKFDSYSTLRYLNKKELSLIEKLSSWHSP